MKKLLLTALLSLPFLIKAQMIPVTNGDFETTTPNGVAPNPVQVQNFTGWTESNTDMVIEPGTPRISGISSVRFTGASTGGSFPPGTPNPRLLTQNAAEAITVVPGKTYKLTFTCRVGSTAGDNNTATQITRTDAFTGGIHTWDGTTLSASPVAFVSTNSISNVTLSVNYLHPLNSTVNQIRLRFNKQEGIAYLDDVTLEDLGVLPITLSSFVGQANNYGVKLNWTTASETNNQYFEILRAGEDKNFISIGKVNGSGNSSTSKSYSFDDFNPATGNNYYQLKHVDFDGKSASFAPIAVSFGLTSNKISLLSSSDLAVTISISSATDKEAVISYVGLDGKIIYQQKTYLKAGLNSITLPVNKSAGNIGIISVSANKEQQSIKISR